MRRYLVIVEKEQGAFSAYTPDLPGCIGVGTTVDEAERAVFAALQMHLEGMRVDNVAIPPNASLAEYLLV